MLPAFFEHYLVFLLVFSRMAGMILFNPLFGRRNIPAVFKMGLALILAFLITMTIPADTGAVILPVFIFGCLKEFFVGYAAGFVLQLFFGSILIAGEIIDMQVGFGMAKFYDPQSNVSMPVSGSFFNIFLMLVFFTTNAHLTFIKVIALSFQIIPPGMTHLGPEIGRYLIDLLGSVFVLALKLALPVTAAEMISEIGLGIVMRAVPQMNIFSVGLQLKAFIGILVLIVMAPLMINFFDGMLNDIFYHLEQGLQVIAG